MESQSSGGWFHTKGQEFLECHMTPKKVPQPSGLASTLSCVIAAHPIGYFWWVNKHTQVYTHTHTHRNWGLLTRWGRPSAPPWACWRWRSQTVSDDKETHRKRKSVTEPWGQRLVFRTRPCMHHSLNRNSSTHPHTLAHTRPTLYDWAHALFRRCGLV